MILCLLLLQFAVTRGFAVEPPPFQVQAASAFDVRSGPLPDKPPGNLVAVAAARDRAAREGRVLVVWVGVKDEALAASLPKAWLQAGPVSEYGGERDHGAAVGVPFGGSLYYRRVVPATWAAINAEAPTDRQYSAAVPNRNSIPRLIPTGSWGTRSVRSRGGNY